MPDLTPLIWFFVIVGSGVTNALIGFFVQRFLIRPLDRRLDALTSALQKFNTGRFLADNEIYNSQNRDPKSKSDREKIAVAAEAVSELKKIESLIDSWDTSGG